ncbi:MAG TPA: NAD(P)H-hydrate dehydratase, partial [Spirochaetales bacterium]|nr:NAD(P)H-hydrate dehydratase [Spirochaetales bacterium]
FTAALAGPGWGADERNAARLESLWDAALPLALDADALGLLATSCLARRCSPLLLTPHPGEFAPLAAVAAGAQPDDPAALELAARRTRFDTAAVVAETAAYFGAVVALKGSVTWIGDPDGRLAVWDGREPALATAGSGDVLVGLAAGFLARGASAWDAAKAAVIAHGLAGRALARRGFFEADALLPEVARLSYGRGINGNQG